MHFELNSFTQNIGCYLQTSAISLKCSDYVQLETSDFSNNDSSSNTLDNYEFIYEDYEGDFLDISKSHD